MVRRMFGVLALVVVPFIVIPTALAPVANAAPPGPIQGCMNGGGQTLTDASGQPFKNQGQCVAYAIHHPVSLADLATSSPFNGTVTLATDHGCSTFDVAFDAVYPGSASVGNVNLHIAGCFNLSSESYSGTFTITTGVGTLSGSAAGPATLTIGGFPPMVLAVLFQPTLTVNAGTGLFTGTTGALVFVTSVSGTCPGNGTCSIVGVVGSG